MGTTVITAGYEMPGTGGGGGSTTAVNVQVNASNTTPVADTFWLDNVPATGEGYLCAGIGVGNLYTEFSQEVILRARVSGLDFFNILQRM